MDAATIEEAIPYGSKEHIIVDVADRLKNLTSLPGTVNFDWRVESSDTWVLQNGVATVIGMTAYCLIDTTLLDEGSYILELFVHFDNSPEHPRLGPVEFRIVK